MKKIVSIIASVALVSVLGCGLVGCGNSNTSSNNKTETEVTYIDSVEEGDIYATGIHHAKVTVEGYKTFTIELNADAAPITVSNFCKLSNDGFYNGLTFHRVVDEFCLQGGDPNGNGTGGSDQDILGEFSSNGVVNKMADNFQRGTVAMARNSVSMNSGSSQFFITLSEIQVASLNGQYAAFGTINKKGMKIVDQIVSDCIGNADSYSGSISNTADQPVIKSIKIVD